MRLRSESKCSEPPNRRGCTPFDLLVHRHYRCIYVFAYRLTHCHANAEDLTQETFVRAYNRFETYDPSRPFLNWLTRITYTLHVDSLRKRKPPQTFSIEAIQQNAEGEARERQMSDEGRNDPQRVVLEKILDERLERALDTLPPEYCQAFLLYDVECLSHQEIAQKLNCSLGTVCSRIHRARTLLQKALMARPELAISVRRTIYLGPLWFFLNALLGMAGGDSG
jgi:RNA polymerase sigma-70 factor (ECF subfamily)